MMEALRLTLFQTSLSWENIETNLSMFSEKLASLKEKTDLVVLPEMFSTGFSMNASNCAETMDGTAVQWMKAKANEYQCVITGSLMIKEGGQFFNRLIWMNPDGTFHKYDKRHLFRLADEQKTFTRGDKKIIVELKGWKILPLVCYDLRFPVWSRRTVKSDYDLLIYVANWPERRVMAWSQLLIARAIENQCYVAGVNRVGNDGNNIYHSGDSAVINFKGEGISGICTHDTCVETVELQRDEVLEFRRQLPFIEDADEFIINQ